MSDNTLIKRQGDYHNLICYRKAELIYDITYHFAHSAFGVGDRTIDQMVQAARSGKQNIVEGNADFETSVEMGIKLINVANMAIILLKQEDYLLHQLLQSLSDSFLQEGGFREKMFRMRLQQKNKTQQ